MRPRRAGLRSQGNRGNDKSGLCGCPTLDAKSASRMGLPHFLGLRDAHLKVDFSVRPIYSDFHHCTVPSAGER